MSDPVQTLQQDQAEFQRRLQALLDEFQVDVESGYDERHIHAFFHSQWNERHGRTRSSGELDLGVCLEGKQS